MNFQRRTILQAGGAMALVHTTPHLLGAYRAGARTAVGNRFDRV